ncbi:MAG: FAD-binding protein [Xanthomonadales bacterium]|nr:FAD-binding protein [Xanthomonadales bacterium]
MAGLCTAIAAAPRPVLLLSRGDHALDCASALAQGGLAAAVGCDDSPDLHATDTLTAGAGDNDRKAVEWLTGSAPGTVTWLESLGIDFDHDQVGYLLAREGGHSRDRVLHLGGDASGSRLVGHLSHVAQKASHIVWKQGCDVDALGLAQDRVVSVRWRQRQKCHATACSAVVLAGGSVAGAFLDTTHPCSSDGAALMLALKAGASGRDLHYIQFHPTALFAQSAADSRMRLITEALRGAGAVLRDHRGHRFMLELHRDGELAPRDVCARGVWQAQLRDGWAWLHAEHLKIDWNRQFPTVLRTCLEAGVDPRKQALPIGVAAHYQVGGLACDLDGHTSVQGVFAVGEIASSGVHGANRLASNSLLEAATAGRRLGQMLSGLTPGPVPEAEHWVERGAPASGDQLACLRQMVQQYLGPLRDASEIRRGLQLVDEGGPLSGRWQAQLLAAIMRSALADPCSRGVHWWRGCTPSQQSVTA